GYRWSGRPEKPEVSPSDHYASRYPHHICRLSLRSIFHRSQLLIPCRVLLEIKGRVFIGSAKVGVGPGARDRVVPELFSELYSCLTRYVDASSSLPVIRQPQSQAGDERLLNLLGTSGGILRRAATRSIGHQRWHSIAVGLVFLLEFAWINGNVELNIV
ncbi:ATP synthase gamma chain, partial [Striga asiatica]